MKKVMLTVGGLIEGATVEAWVGDDTWNGFEMPMMTEAQMDALIKVQDPKLNPCENECERVIFMRQDGYLRHVYDEEDFVVEEITKTKMKTPDGEILYDVSFNWNWELTDATV